MGIIAKVFAEGTSYNIGLDASSVFSGLLSVLSANIVPILTLMGLALGLRYVLTGFNKAKKGKI